MCTFIHCISTAVTVFTTAVSTVHWWFHLTCSHAYAVLYVILYNILCIIHSYTVYSYPLSSMQVGVWCHYMGDMHIR